MNIFLVDCENTTFSLSCENMENSEIVYFLSKAVSNNMKAAIDRIKSVYKEKIKVINCLNGEKNAMDIQLSYYLGHNCSPENSYYIVSGDKGYDSMISFARKTNIDITRINGNTDFEADKECARAKRLRKTCLELGKNNDAKMVLLYMVKKRRPGDLKYAKSVFNVSSVDRKHAIKAFARLLKRYKKLDIEDPIELSKLMSVIDRGGTEWKLYSFKHRFIDAFGEEEFRKIDQENVMKMVGCLL